MTKIIQRRFGFGETDPRINGLTDSEQYTSSFREAKNVVWSHLGGPRKRDGNTFLSTASGLVPRLFPFQIPAEGSFVIEFSVTSSSTRIWDTTARTSIAGPTNPWGNTSRISRAQFEAFGKYLVLVAEDNEPMVVFKDDQGAWQMKLWRDAPNAFTAKINLRTNANLISVAGSAVEAGVVKLSSSFSYFEQGDSPGFWRVGGGWMQITEFIDALNMSAINTGLITDLDQAFSDWTGPYKSTLRTFSNTITQDVAAAAGEIASFTLSGGDTWLESDMGQLFSLNDSLITLMVPHLRTSSTVARATIVRCGGGN